MSKEIKAISTIIAGTIGVGFVALPYGIKEFGTIGGIFLLSVVSILIIVTNLAFSDIITTDKNNMQIGGYTKKYLGSLPSYIVSIIIIVGSIGVLFAYSMLAGAAMKVVLSSITTVLSERLLSVIFVLVAVFVMKYGVKFISKVSASSVLLLLVAVVVLLVLSIPNVSLENVTPLKLSQFPLMFGVSIFSLYSAASIPVIDEIIGYNKRKYKKVIIIANLLTLLIYIVFGAIISLSLGDNITSELVDSFGSDQRLASLILSLLVIVAIFTSFVLISNSVKEIFSYDYKIKNNIAVLLVLAPIIWLLVFEFLDFETIVSKVGNIALAFQSLTIFAIWFKMGISKSIWYKLLVASSGFILVVGMISQI